MAKFVEIQSSITIRVTCGLQNQDVTNPDAHIPDRLKVNPEWPKYQVLIRAGKGQYPADIATWNSVKALEHDGILTIGQTFEKDELDKDEQATLDTVTEAKNAFKLDIKKGKKVTLNDLAE